MSRLLEHFLVNDNVEEFHLQAKKIQTTLSSFHSDGHTSRFPFLTYFKVNLIVGFRFAVDTIARNVASCNMFLANCNALLTRALSCNMQLSRINAYIISSLHQSMK